MTPIRLATVADATEIARLTTQLGYDVTNDSVSAPLSRSSGAPPITSWWPRRAIASSAGCMRRRVSTWMSIRT